MEGIWGLIGVVIGSVFTLGFQYFTEIRREIVREREIFLKQYREIHDNIYKIKCLLICYKNYLKIDINTQTDEYFDSNLESEIYNPLVRYSKECSDIWVGFKDILEKYFYKIDKESFPVLDDAVTTILDMRIGHGFGIGFEMLKDNHSYLRKDKEKIKKAFLVINSIEKECFQMKKKFLKKRI